MVDFDRAYSNVIDILQDRPKSKNPICFKMYKGTNENLTKIFRRYDFKDKDVLSVLSSSDQMMSSYYLGASNVDTFDRNFTPYLFFYLIFLIKSVAIIDVDLIIAFLFALSSDGPAPFAE